MNRAVLMTGLLGLLLITPQFSWAQSRQGGHYTPPHIGGGGSFTFFQQGRSKPSIPTRGSYKTTRHIGKKSYIEVEQADPPPPTGNYARRTPLPKKEPEGITYQIDCSSRGTNCI